MVTCQSVLFANISCPPVEIVREFSGENAPTVSRGVRKKAISHPDSLKSRFKRIFCFRDEDVVGIPIVCIGPEGLSR